MSSTVTFDDVLQARRRIETSVFVTPCTESTALSEICGCQVFCKLEYLQRTGSFKERGARNALEQLPADQRSTGVIAASAGNHALALAFHGRELGIPVAVAMPRFAPLIKQNRCRQLGARVILAGDTFGDAKDAATKLAAEQGMQYIHGFDAPEIIAGQGTIGLEIAEQIPAVDAVLVPVGGAGLIAGTALAIKHLQPNSQVIGIEAAHAACLSPAMAAGHPVPVAMRPTLADGLAVGQVGSLSLELAAKHVDRLIQVSEDHLALAIVRLMELEKSVVEGAGAAPLAALIGRYLPDLSGKKVVLVLAGGNIDLPILARLIDSALVTDGRLVRFTAVISDRPGGLALLARLIAEVGGSIHDIMHDRVFSGSDVTAVNVLCTVETHDEPHIAELFAKLHENGIQTYRGARTDSPQKPLS